MTFLPKPPIDNLGIFLSKCHRRRYPSKSTIIYAGDKADVLYYIVKGTVSVLVEEQKDIKTQRDGYHLLTCGGVFWRNGSF